MHSPDTTPETLLNAPKSKRKLRQVATTAAALMGIAVASAAGAQNLTYVDILHQLTDLDRLTHLQTGQQAGIFSSWDRTSKTIWGANGDAGQYLRIEPRTGEAVMMDIDGPGIIYRTWSANPVGKIRIYIDGATTPTFEWNFPDLFDGKLGPFIKPLVYRRDSAQSASDCYVPIPFAKHIKITADKAHAEYYHFNYILLPKTASVPSFRLPLTAEETGALSSAAAAWGHPEKDPKPALPGQRTIHKTLTIAPGKTANLANLNGAGCIRAIRIKATSSQRYAPRKLVLTGTWDGASWPQVKTPIGPFFGYDWDTPDYASVIAGVRGGSAYQYYPMPFRKSAQLGVTNYLEQPAKVEVDIEWAPFKSQPADMLYFYARWRHEPDSLTFDYPFVETAGHGHFVGVSMPIDHPLGGWWGEGDEKVWVDDDDWPRWIGTGSEDYFGDAWGIRYLSGPSFGASADSDARHRTCNYRWHFMDYIPFEKRMRMTIENYGPNGQGPRGQYDYSSTAFWYQQELTPPFAELDGITFTGGDDPNGKPETRKYNPATMADVTAADVRTYGLGITFTTPAEKLLTGKKKPRIVTDAKRSYEFDRERAVDLGILRAQDHPGAITLKAPETGIYYPRVFTAAEDGIALLTLDIGGKSLTITGRPTKGVLELEGIPLKQGDNPAILTAASAGRAIFNALQLEPAHREHDALEAEELTVVTTTGGLKSAAAGTPDKTLSAGRALILDAEKPGQGAVFLTGKRPELPYVLGVMPMYGPGAGIIQAFAAGRAIGPQFDLYAPAAHIGGIVLPLGPLPSSEKQFEIRVVGHNPASSGYRAALDYFRWEPTILGPGTREGVWAQIAAVRDCDYRGQDLGPAYSDGHQLWIQPSNLNSLVDIAIEIPEAGEYAIEVRYVHSWDYATVQAFLDGDKIGTATDCYAEAVKPGEQLRLGVKALSAGRHILRFQAVDHNHDSKGYLMGIDHITIKQP